jgi:hypothetical protein
LKVVFGFELFLFDAKGEKIQVKVGLADLQKLHLKATRRLRPRIKMVLVMLQRDLHTKTALAG